MDVKQERRIGDYWNIDGSRDLSASWTGFTQFTLLSEKPPDGYMWSGERLTRRLLTSRPDHLWPGLWIKLGRNAQLKEKHKWSHEKQKIDNARRLRGIYFIDPQDKEFKETIRNARKQLETPMAPAMPCKTCRKSKHGDTRSKTNDSKSKFAYLGSQWIHKNAYGRISTKNIMRTTLQEKGTIHYNSTIWYTYLFVCLKPWRFQQRKQQWIKNGRNLKRFRRGTQQ